MPGPSVTSTQLDYTGRYLVTLSDGRQFYVPATMPAVGPPVGLSSAPAALTAGADTPLTFAAPVRAVNVQNNSTTKKWVNFDAVASNGVLVAVDSGQLLSHDVSCAVLHVWSSAADTLNSATTGIAVWGVS